ncbi:hypothetical protein [Rhodococcoides kyotonense]|uniref:Membrane protein involved in the export of O-antigen and teichoic acid n=1 Tax=Rhodococcoides kyotonense TaxID=398843 RepID=A0A239LL42_9NOCA|nr:hypothetical protein [Rhodococcus kyotonensis]SNT30389.1 Membrane protein involved in the export of O-antigen and teichoic acid [Rhodococcus kyotonensis]
MTSTDTGARSLAFRLLKGGLPAIAASAFVAFVPILGSAYLSVDDYAVWALAATLSTIFIVFDFGTPTLATKLAGGGHLDFRTSTILCGLSALPPIVLGAVAIAIWPAYSTAAGLHGSAYSLIALVSLGGVLRSIGIVYGAAALGRSHFYRRTAVLFFGGSVQLVATLVALESGAGIISLGIGTVIAGAVQAIIGFALEGGRRRNDAALQADTSASVRQTIVLFMKTRVVVAMLGLLITQLDRWALGLVGDAELLARYDIATRFVMIPKIVLIALAAGLVADSSRLTTTEQGAALLARVQKLVVLVMVPLMSAAAFVAFLAQKVALGLTPSLIVVVLIAAAHGANCATIAPVNILTGAGRPDIELRYLVPLAVVVVIGYGAGIATGAGMTLIVVWSAAMVAFSLWFTAMSGRYVREVLA